MKLLAVILFFTSATSLSAQPDKSNSFDPMVRAAAFTFYGMKPGCGTIDDGEPVSWDPLSTDCDGNEARRERQQKQLQTIRAFLQQTLEGDDEFSRERSKKAAEANYKKVLGQRFVIRSRFRLPEYDFSDGAFHLERPNASELSYQKLLSQAGATNHREPTVFERALEGTDCTLVNKAVPPEPLKLEKTSAEKLAKESGHLFRLITVFEFAGIETDADVKRRNRDPIVRALGDSERHLFCRGLEARVEIGSHRIPVHFQ